MRCPALPVNVVNNTAGNTQRLLCTCDFPPRRGGQARYFGHLWHECGPGDLLLIPRQGRSLSRNGQKFRTVFAFLPEGERWGARFLRLSLLLLYVLVTVFRFRPKQAHFGQIMVGGLCGLVLRLCLGIPYVVYAFGSDVLEFSRGWVGCRLLRAIIKKSSGVIACSNFTATKVRDIAGLDAPTIGVVLPGVEDRFFHADPLETEHLRARLKLAGKRVVLTIGRLVERKGHATVIRSLPLLLRSDPNLHYLVVGEGSHLTKLQALSAQCGVQGSVTFCRDIRDEELPACYRLAEVFVMISRLREKEGDIEGFGIVYLEANASGLPVIAGRSGGVVDAVEDGVNGLLVEDPSSPEKVAAAILRLLRDRPLYSRLAREGRRRAESLTWEHQCSRWRREIAKMLD